MPLTRSCWFYMLRVMNEHTMVECQWFCKMLKTLFRLPAQIFVYVANKACILRYTLNTLVNALSPYCNVQPKLGVWALMRFVHLFTIFSFYFKLGNIHINWSDTCTAQIVVCAIRSPIWKRVYWNCYQSSIQTAIGNNCSFMARNGSLFVAYFIVVWRSRNDCIAKGRKFLYEIAQLGW